jgi:hypothetical protein
MSFKELEQKHNLVNRVILACGKHPVDADINPLLEERLERFYEDAVIEGMAKQMHSSVDRAVNAMVDPQMIRMEKGKFSYIKKPWVGLTNEELVEIREAHQTHIFQLMFAVEAKIREKNNAV